MKFNTYASKTDSQSILNLAGKFTGAPEEIEEVKTTLRKGGMLDTQKIYLKIHDNFKSDQFPLLMKIIQTHALGGIVIQDPRFTYLRHFSLSATK